VPKVRVELTRVAPLVFEFCVAGIFLSRPVPDSPVS
jgi:hypothetical protein